MKFKLKSDFKPTGDQPQAIEKLTLGIQKGEPFQVLLGVTGSGKTFTIANVIENIQKPVLVISHNKTLAAQLYQEFREFFPQNAVSYFVSYYDYFQPEAYIPQTDTYIAKEVDINQEIDKLRLLATSHIFSRKDVIVVASVSCIYNIGAPEQYRRWVLPIRPGQEIKREEFLSSLVALHYQRSRLEFGRGNFRVRGEGVEIYLPYKDEILRVVWEDRKISRISSRPVFTGQEKEVKQDFIFPAKHYLADSEVMKASFSQIRQDLKTQLGKLEKGGKLLEANRLRQRVNYDLEIIKEIGYVNGIENYSRYFDGRLPGEPPFSLVDYFCHQYQDDFLVVIDESHLTVPQIKGMYRGDRARKKTLIDFGFRLPSCLDNRPLKATEFWQKAPRAIFASATPNEWEIEKSDGKVVEQLIRPTGLPDPEVEICPSDNQIQDLIRRILVRKKKNERALVTTLTKKTAEELARYLSEVDTSEVKNTSGVAGWSRAEAMTPRRWRNEEKIKVHYLHADVATLERTEILRSLRTGDYDVIVGINLLREGLDLPEVSLVAILDADQQGFLRSKTSLVQTMGRAARNIGSQVVLYADEITVAIEQALNEVNRRRLIQLKYNRDHGIKPQTIQKPIRERLVEKTEEEEIDEEGLTPGEARKLIAKLRRQMRQYARVLDFEKAAGIRDRIEKIKERFDLEM